MFLSINRYWQLGRISDKALIVKLAAYTKALANGFASDASDQVAAKFADHSGLAISTAMSGVPEHTILGSFQKTEKSVR